LRLGFTSPGNCPANCYDEARPIIRENRVVIDRLVDLLIEKKPSTAKRVSVIVAEYTFVPEEQYVPQL